MPFTRVQSTPRSGNPADPPLKADGRRGTGRKLQAPASWGGGGGPAPQGSHPPGVAGTQRIGHRAQWGMEQSAAATHGQLRRDKWE